MLLRKLALLGAAYYAMSLFLEREDDKKSIFLRGYARDQFADPLTPGFERASKVAAETGVPIGWVIALQSRVPPQRLEDAARATKAAFLMPPDSKTQTLVDARSAALAAGVRHVQG